MIEFESRFDALRPRITVMGVGGAGGNAVANMIRAGVQGVDFVAANTDAQALRASPAERILQLGRATTDGLGAGSRAEIGRAAAEESLAEIDRILEGVHMCFIAAGLGGGTGTGAAPVIARAARARGILTVGVVTTPFAFEGSRRARAAEAGLAAIEAEVDSLIVIPNQNLFRIASPDTTFKQAFDLADEVLQKGVRGITDLMVMPGFVNLDFADIRTIMAGMGKALMGTGEASGEDRALRAAEAAIANPLLDEAIKGARGLIVSICGGEDMGLMEVDEAASYIKGQIDPEADIIWGSAFNADLEGRMRVSVVATGIDSQVEASIEAPLAHSAPEAPNLIASTAATTVPETPARLPAPAPSFSGTTAIEASLLDPYITAACSLDPRSQPELFLAEPLVLTPPSAEAMAAAEAAAIRADDSARQGIRGPSLFERMTMAARGAVRKSEDMPPLTHIQRGPVSLDRRAA